jgi:hypothetical protein
VPKGAPRATRFAWAPNGCPTALPIVIDGKVRNGLDYEVAASHIASIFKTEYLMEGGRIVLRFAFEILCGRYYDQPFEARFRITDRKRSIREKARGQIKCIADALGLSEIRSVREFEGKPLRINFLKTGWHDPWIEVKEFSCGPAYKAA